MLLVRFEYKKKNNKFDRNQNCPEIKKVDRLLLIIGPNKMFSAPNIKSYARL